MASLGQLVVNLEANIARFTSDMGRASQTVEQTMGRMNAAADKVKTILGAVGVALSADLIVGEINKSLDALAQLDDMAQKTGSSVETLSKLSKVAAFTGTDLSAVDGILIKLSKNLAAADEEGNKTAKALAAIGISTDDLKAKDPSEVFVEVAKKLQDYEDGANKVALVTDLMGKSAAEMLPFMNDVAESLDKFQGDSAKSAAQAAALQDQIGILRVRYAEWRTEIVVAALPAANAFIGALTDTKREANSLTGGTRVDTWADNVAIVLARVADRAKLVVGTLSAVAGSVRVIGADIETLAKASPAYMAAQIAQGKNPLDDYRAMVKGREKILADANARWEELLKAPVNVFEKETIKRIAEERDAAGLAVLGGMVGLNSVGQKKSLTYGGGDPKSTKDPKKEKEGWTADGAADRMVRSALNETLAIQGTIEATEALQKADQQRADAHARAMNQNAESVERIRQELMTDVEYEQFGYEKKIEQLRIYGESRVGIETTVNALVEQETARHNAALAAMDQQAYEQKMMLNLQSVQMAGSTADMMYNMLKQSGDKQSSLAKAAFLFSKGLAVAEIIIQTNVAAAKAKGQLGIFGMPMSALILATGYSQAATVAGMAIASAEGGYDIPGGVNPVTQLHEKEMVLPKAQAEVIRGLARNGGAGGGVTIHNSPVINIDSRTDQQEVRRIVADGVARGNADLVDRLSRSGRI